MALTGAAIAYATVVFQTITNNRILTPSIIGMDSVYQLFQTIMVFFWGSTTLQFVDQQINFLITVTLMIGFALLLYQVLFRKDGTNLHFLLLMGIVMGTLFGSLTTFLQVLIDPNEYAGLQSRLFASVSRVNTNLLFLGGGLMIPVMLYGLRYVRTLDAIALGRDHAVNLGVDYGPVLRRMLIVVAVLMAASTALVGPITFLGLLVANISYHLLDTYRRGPLIAAAVAVGVVFLVGGAAHHGAGPRLHHAGQRDRELHRRHVLPLPGIEGENGMVKVQGRFQVLRAQAGAARRLAGHRKGQGDDAHRPQRRGQVHPALADVAAVAQGHRRRS